MLLAYVRFAATLAKSAATQLDQESEAAARVATADLNWAAFLIDISAFGLRPSWSPTMMHSFPELTIGGVLIAPFVIYAGAAIAIFAVLRPFLHLVGFDRAFSSPPIAELSLYVVILALLIVLF